MIYTQKAAVLFNGVWQMVIGMTDNKTADFVFVLNTKIERVPDGSWRTYPINYHDRDLENDITALNLNLLTRKYPKIQRVVRPR